MDQNTLIIGAEILVIGLVILTAIYYWLKNLEKKSRPSDELVNWLKDVSRRIETSSLNMDRKMTDNMDMFNNRLDKAATVIGSVQKSIGEFSEIGRSMKELEELLKSPKLRGNIGEHVLKELLSQYLPSAAYELQFAFKNGERVDAVIKTSQGIIPVDSKFPLENFRKYNRAEDEVSKIRSKKDFGRDVKKHIDDISKKYINAAEKTVDYAIMYVPSEAIYYEIINDTELFDYSGARRVLPVSPLSFYAYLRAILMSFEGQKIQKEAKKILETLQQIKKDYEKTETALNLLNKHLTNAYNQSTNLSGSLGMLGRSISSIDLLSDNKEEVDLIDKETKI